MKHNKRLKIKEFKIKASEIWERSRLSENIPKFSFELSCSVDFECFCIAWVSVWDRGCWVEFSVSGFPPEGAQAVSRNTQSTHPELSLCLLLSPCPPSHRSCGEEQFQWRCRKTYPFFMPSQVPLHNRTSLFPSAHLALSLFGLSFWLSLSLSFVLHFATFLTSLTKAGTVPCLNGAHLPVLTDASRNTLIQTEAFEHSLRLHGGHSQVSKSSASVCGPNTGANVA